MPADDQKGRATGGQLSILSDLAEMLEAPEDIPGTLNAALKLLADGLGMMRGAITLISPATGKIRIEAAHGLNEDQRKLGSYALGEGITGRVIQSGQPMCVADISREPLFLNKTRSRDLRRDRVAFICVPIKLRGQIVGAISVDKLRAGPNLLNEELRLLRIIASLLAQAASDSQAMMEDAARHGNRPRGFIGNSPAMRQIYDQIDMVANSAITVLLQGESGTGKELAAAAIHSASQRSNGPFISLNCAALPESLIESELFGHERGAFTGATQKRKGRFELARGGTLFLDEVGELSPSTQAKLLRVLQEHAFERVGGMESLHSDARVIAATNRDLAGMVENGSFRRDLYYRLNVFPIFLPPLRSRQDDILPLADSFLKTFARQAGKKKPAMSFAVMETLQNYSWPGNIRELQNVLERAVLLLGVENVLLPRHLPANMQTRDGQGEFAAPQNDGRNLAGLRNRLEEVERLYLLEALEMSRGNVKRAAEMLGQTVRVTALRLKKYGIDYRQFRKK